MRRLVLSLVVGIVVLACSKDQKNIMLVQGEIKNLKKGTLYLQKIKDTVLVSVDSILLDGVNTFTLSDKVESPEIYYLSLNKLPSKQISFFGETGTITINTKLDKFLFGATVNGLTNQQLLDEYNAMKDQFSDRRLDLIKVDFETKKLGDTLKIDSVQKLINNLIKRRYYYTTNFAVNHPDNEVSPYLAITELYDANINLLDTINNSLTPKVKDSKYGKALEKFIRDIKNNE